MLSLENTHAQDAIFGFASTGFGGLISSGTTSLETSGDQAVIGFSSASAATMSFGRIYATPAAPPVLHSPGGLGIALDGGGLAWSIAINGDAVSLAHDDSGGVFTASTTLPGADSSFPWNVVFDASGNAYAVGAAIDPSSGADLLAVYRASSSGDAIISSQTFDSGYDNNNLVFGVAASSWIVGAVQTQGPISFNDPGSRSFSMAIWRFTASSGLIELTTTYSRAGADLATSASVDSAGNLWVAGFSFSPSPRSTRGYDLALWKYASDGHTLLAGPFIREGYLDDINTSLLAKTTISSGTVFVTAPRGRGAGGTDMALVSFSTSTGQVLSENAWRPNDGSSVYPAALLQDGSGGVTVAGGFDYGDGATLAGLWHYGINGSTQAVGQDDAGGARAAAANGSNFWLMVDGSTSPYLDVLASEPPATGSVSDITPPHSTISISCPSSSGNPIYVATTTLFGFLVDDGAGVGAAQTQYAIGSSAFSLFASSFSLVSEGTTSISFYSLDLEGNAEAIQSASVIVDSTPPTATFVSSGTDFAILAEDPLSSGTASGLARVSYLVDEDPSSCVGVPPSTSAASGTCANPDYAGAFFVGYETHTVYFGASDQVGNGRDVYHSSTVFVSPPSGDGAGLGMALDGSGLLWSVALEGNQVSLARNDADGVFTASATLAGADSAFPWNVFFDGSDAYAVGSSLNASTADVVAIYKASSSGDEIVSSHTFDSGYSNNNLVFDAVAPGWIVGSVQTSGPVDLNEPGSRTYSLAIWRFDTGTGLTQLTTTYTRNGFDVATGIVVDGGTGHLWVVGFSSSTNPFDLAYSGDPHYFDLALWEFSSDGQSLLHGPYIRDGYQSNYNTSMLARVAVASGTVYVTAPRGSRLGGNVNDVALTAFDPATGAVLAESVWRAGDGSSIQTSALLQSSTDHLLVAGEFSYPDGNVAGLWRYELGSSLQTVAASQVDAGGASEAIINGSNLWLTVNGSTSPFLDAAERPVVGAFEDLTPPLTNLQVDGANVSTTSLVIRSTDSVGLSAADAGVGVSQTFFALDGAALSVYSSTFSLAIGTHSIAYQSTDIAANLEALHEVSLTVVSSSSLAAVFSSIIPSTGPIGAPFTITGSGFGVYNGTSTIVTFSGLTAPITYWDDGTIQGTVPGAASTGAAAVVIERDSGSGLQQSSTQPFFVVVPVISTMTPDFGPGDTAVTITGTGFGDYAGDATQLLVGGSTASLAVWIDTEIVWTVPTDLADGTYPVVVSLLPSDGGSSESNSVDFTVASGMGPGALTRRAPPPLSIRPDWHFQGDMNLIATRGGRIQTPSGAAVQFAPRSFTRNTEVTIVRGRDLHKADRFAAMKRAQLGSAGEAIAFGPEGSRFAHSATIELPYDPTLVTPGQLGAVQVHYYDPGTKTWTALPSQADPVRHVLFAETDHFSLYQPLGRGIGTAALDAKFGLKAVYVFPNPARGTNAVTIRVQPGLADEVSVRIYDLSGRKVHSSSMFIQGQTDDGNGLGLQYTYDHAWNISGVGSGVYTYVITARKAGMSDLHKTGKIGVVK